MECREIKVGGWAFLFQVLPVVKELGATPIATRDKCIDPFLARSLALEILNEDADLDLDPEG